MLSMTQLHQIMAKIWYQCFSTWLTVFSFLSRHNLIEGTWCSWNTNLYHTTLSQLLDKHSTVTVSSRRICKSDAWFNNECRGKKKKMRQLEKLFKSNKPGSRRVSWLDAQRDMREIFRRKRSTYWTNRMKSEWQNPQQLWKLLNIASSYTKTNFEPVHAVTDFVTFFTSKLKPYEPRWHHSATTTFQWQCCPISIMSILEKNRLLSIAPSKQCFLNLMPTWLRKGSKVYLLPVLTDLCNKSPRNSAKLSQSCCSYSNHKEIKSRSTWHG